MPSPIGTRRFGKCRRIVAPCATQAAALVLVGRHQPCTSTTTCQLSSITSRPAPPQPLQHQHLNKYCSWTKLLLHTYNPSCQHQGYKNHPHMSSRSPPVHNKPHHHQTVASARPGASLPSAPPNQPLPAPTRFPIAPRNPRFQHVLLSALTENGTVTVPTQPTSKEVPAAVPQKDSYVATRLSAALPANTKPFLLYCLWRTP